MSTDEMRAALDTFMVESADLLTQMETGLLDLESGNADAETLNAVFRAAHTIKGSAGLFGLDDIVAFTHVLESALDALRNDEIAVSAGLIGAMLPGKDHLAALIGGVARGTPTGAAEAETGEALLLRLRGFLGTGDQAAETAAIDRAPHDEGASAARMHISLRFGPDCLRSGMDPIAFIHYLSTVGDLVSVTTVTDLLPAADAMDAETSYLGFEITLHTTAGIAAVEEVFDFVRSDSDIRILTDASPLADYRDLVASFGPHSAQIAEILIRSGAATAEDLGGTRDERDDAAGASGAVGEAVTGQPPADAAQSREWAPANRVARASDVNSIRVDAARLDRLIDTVGELVIAGAGAGLGAKVCGDEDLRASIGEVMRLIEGVRSNALRLRMVPIGTTFSRFQRVVRDVSTDLGKDVSLVITGGETEVDKALVEQIADPLTHLVRNALDHGIEPADVRVARGKSARGTLHLNAFHDSGSIVVVVEDDGGGIDRSQVLAKAVERGLVDPAATPSDKDIDALIFEPGFSTAAQVSNLSGRGVGMDVVKRNVTAMRGAIDVESRPHEGTTVQIRLPLTLAIINGFLVGVGTATFVIPLDHVVECVELPLTGQRRDYLDLRGEVLPLIRLWSLLSVPGDRPRRESVVVVEHAGTKTGLVVDTLKGESQTVIKPLGKLFAHVEGIGGSTILGSGEVALIIDVATLVAHVKALAGLANVS
jgi:two-component system, chemotaxis family, sensor kinase CheA